MVNLTEVEEILPVAVGCVGGIAKNSMKKKKERG
jgi:hypothetical protein